MSIQIFLLTLLFSCLISCEKEDLNANVSIFNNHNTRSFSNLVTYNSTYNVLEFASFEDVQLISEQILLSNDNYVYDEGNTIQLLSIIGNAISDPSTNDLINSQSLFENSYPLSDTVLKRMIEFVNIEIDTLEFDFISNLIIENVPLSRQILVDIQGSNLLPTHIEKIKESDLSYTLDKNHAFNDFLGEFPDFNSLWSARRIEIKNALDQGQQPDIVYSSFDFLEMDIEQLLFNADNEIYIDGHLFKIYTDCKLIISRAHIDDAYAEISQLDSDGFIIPPSPIETNDGIDFTVMGTVFPMNITFSETDNYSPDLTILADINSINNLECPQSAFTYINLFDGDDYLNVYFTNLTPESFDGTFYHYWTFGDGTGSFQLDPIHKYSELGDYTVKLTTFNSDCGCWDVITQTVEVADLSKPPGQFCDVSFSYFPESPGSNTYTFSIDASSYTVPFSTINTVTWNFGDGSPLETGLTISHTYSGITNPTVTMNVEFDPVDGLSGCINGHSLTINDVGSIGACVQKDKFKSDYIPLYGGDYSTIVECKYNGHTLIGLFGGRIKAQTRFFKQRSGGSWKRQKADNITVEYDADIYYIDSTDQCDELEHLDDSKSKTNESGVLLWSPASDQPFGANDGAVNSYHRIKFDGVFSPIFFINL